LAVVVVEMEMMVGMVCCAVDHGVGGKVFAVVDHDCPELDEDEEEEVIEFLEGENKWEEMVWYGLVIC
jgi:hypothetical protein